MYLKGVNEPACTKYLAQSWTHGEQLKHVLNSVFYPQELAFWPSFCIKAIRGKELKNDLSRCETLLFSY